MWVKVEFPEHAWETWKFFGTPKEWWHQIYELFNCDDAVVQAVVRQYVEHIEKDLVAKLSTDQIDWKRISEKQLDRTAAKHFRRLGGFRETIQKLFPELGVRKSHLGKKLAVQLQLRAVTNSLFPIENEGTHSTISICVILQNSSHHRNRSESRQHRTFYCTLINCIYYHLP